MSFKMAIVGYGGMGSWHHSNIKELNKEIEVVGAFDIRPEAKEKIIENKLHSYENIQKLYDDKSIDLVLVSTPNDTHVTYAISLLKSGKNVICEKPVTLNKAELERIYEVSEKTGKFFTVHQNRRWDSDLLTVKNIFENKILSKPYTIESRVQGSRKSLHGWRGYKINGGGMVYDWGIHLMDQMLQLIPSKIIEVEAHLHSIDAKEVDDDFTAMFRFENGLTFIINIDMQCFILQPRWYLKCSDGTAIIENWELDGKIVKLLDDEGSLDWSEDIVYTAAGPTRSMVPRPKNTTQEIPLPIVKGEWSDYYKNIADVLNGKSSLIVTKEQALRLMELVDLVFLSNDNKQSVKCFL